MEFVANESKKVEIETSTGVYQRHAIQTHFVQIGENYIDLIERYVKPLYEEGDLLSISEKVIALCQKRIVYRKDIHPGFWAKLLCRFVHVTPAGPGAGTPHKMQLIIMICGLPRVLLAAFCSAVTKLFGKKGVFYKVCGHEVDGIDGLIDYDISFKEYVDYGILNPENPSGVCDEIYEKTGVKAMIEDNRYCMDIMMQLQAVESLVHKAQREVLRGHLSGCVQDAFETGDQNEREQKIAEIIKLLDKA